MHKGLPRERDTTKCNRKGIVGYLLVQNDARETTAAIDATRFMSD